MPYQGYYSRQEVEATSCPFWTGSRWIGDFPDICVLLTKTRCKHFGFPVADDEQPVAFRYTTNGPGTHKYTPVYDRIGCFIDDKLLLHFEFVTTPREPEIERKLLTLKSKRYRLQEDVNNPHVDEERKAAYRKALDNVQREIDAYENDKEDEEA